MTLRHLWPLLLLAACSPETPSKPVAPKTTVKAPNPDALPVYRVAVAPGGLLLTDPRGGVAKPADFGLRQSLLIAILARSFGTAAEGHDKACAKDFARWPNGLTVWFDAGDFVGWSLQEPASAIGIAPGLERQAQMKGGRACND
jgi:hypothetical protein